MWPFKKDGSGSIYRCDYPGQLVKPVFIPPPKPEDTKEWTVIENNPRDFTLRLSGEFWQWNLWWENDDPLDSYWQARYWARDYPGFISLEEAWAHRDKLEATPQQTIHKDPKVYT